jgi:hypothetical protein
MQRLFFLTLKMHVLFTNYICFLKNFGEFQLSFLLLEVDAFINNFMLRFWAFLCVFSSFPFHVPIFVQIHPPSQVYDPSDLILPIIIPSGGILSIYQILFANTSSVFCN